MFYLSHGLGMDEMVVAPARRITEMKTQQHGIYLQEISVHSSTECWLAQIWNPFQPVNQFSLCPLQRQTVGKPLSDFASLLTYFSSTVGRHSAAWDDHSLGLGTSPWRHQSPPPCPWVGRRWQAQTAWKRWSENGKNIHGLRTKLSLKVHHPQRCYPLKVAVDTE